MSDEKLMDEPGRILALKRYGVLDSGREQNFDAITSLVCSVLDVPICAVSLVDEERQWFKSIAGLDVSETPREQAFCDHTIRARGVMQVDDATADARFAGNELVTSDPLIRSYVGAPLVTPDGYQLGALCAIDRKPRSFNANQRALLERFSGLVVEQLELRTLAHQDFLTNALSRRAFCESARAALGQHARDRSPAALLTFDVDHFKALRPRHRRSSSQGHRRGLSRRATPGRFVRTSRRRGIRSVIAKHRGRTSAGLRRAPPRCDSTQSRAGLSCGQRELRHGDGH
jgi:GAF domain-containing protein